MNKHQNRKAFTFLAAIVLLISGCKVSKQVIIDNQQVIPEQFLSESDTSQLEGLDWAAYFNDQYLRALIDTALSYNYDLQQAYQRINMAGAGVMIAKGAMLPEVSGVATGSNMRMAKYSADWAGNEGAVYADGTTMRRNIPDYFVGFETQWEADIRGKLRNEKKAAVNRYLASVEGTRYIITELIAEVSAAYYELLALDLRQEILGQTLKKQEEALEVARYSKEAGRINELAVQQFEAQTLNTSSLLKSNEQQVLEAESRINYLLGRFPQEVKRSSELTNDMLADQINAGVPTDLLENRPDIREAKHMLEASRFDTKAARAAFYPSFNIGFNIGFQSYNPEFVLRTPASIAYGLAGQIAGPLLNRKAIKGQFKDAKANQVEALYQYQESVLSGYIEVYNEMQSLQNLIDVASLTGRESEVLERAIDTSNELYRTGKAGYIEVLIAQQEALETKMDLIEVQRQANISRVNLYRALGGGWE